MIVIRLHRPLGEPRHSFCFAGYALESLKAILEALDGSWLALRRMMMDLGGSWAFSCMNVGDLG